MAVAAKFWLSLLIVLTALSSLVSGMTNQQKPLMRKARLDKETSIKGSVRSHHGASDEIEVVLGSNANMHTKFGDSQDKQGVKLAQKTTKPTCKDMVEQWKCKQRKKWGLCKKQYNKVQCAKTCGHCAKLKAAMSKADDNVPEDVVCNSFECTRGSYNMDRLMCPAGSNSTYCKELCCDRRPMPQAIEGMGCVAVNGNPRPPNPVKECPCKKSACTKTWTCIREHKSKGSQAAQEACDRVQQWNELGGQPDVSTSARRQQVRDERCCKAVLEPCSRWQSACYDLLRQTYNWFPLTSDCENGGELPGCVAPPSDSDPAPEGETLMQSPKVERSGDSFSGAPSLMHRPQSTASKAQGGQALDETLRDKCVT